jgi:hypothetical protein
VILIIEDKIDSSTIEVYNWLSSFGIAKCDLIILTEEDIFTLDYIGIDSFRISNDSRQIDSSLISAIWFRRGRIKLRLKHTVFEDKFDRRLAQANFDVVQEYFDYLCWNHLVCLGNPMKLSVNKLEMLHLAKSVGFKVPHSLFTGHRNALSLFLGSSVITKLLYSPLIPYDQQLLNLQTFAVNSSELQEVFSDSFFQVRLKKKAELRVVYFMGEVNVKLIRYGDNQSEPVDYRMYSDANTPDFIEVCDDELASKICLFMEKADLNFGCLDFVVDQEDNYIFLEVNPIGQFSQTSDIMNFNIELSIANKLKEYYNAHQLSHSD